METHYHVGMNGYKKVTYPDYVDTDGIGPCIGIGIFNIKTKNAYLAHFLPMTKDLLKVLDEAVEEASSPSDLELVVAGNTSLDDQTLIDLGEDLQKHRYNLKSYSEWIRTEIKNRGLRIKKDYLKENYLDGSFSISIDTKKSKLVVNYDETYSF